MYRRTPIAWEWTRIGLPARLLLGDTCTSASTRVGLRAPAFVRLALVRVATFPLATIQWTASSQRQHEHTLGSGIVPYPRTRTEAEHDGSVEPRA